MFIGHFAVGFAAKRAAPKTSLGVLMAAPLLLDLLWPVFVLTGIEQVRIDPGNTVVTPLAFDHYPISHSLVTSLGLALVFALLYWSITHYRAGAVVIGFAVVSHWFLDAIVHRPDLPLYPGSAIQVGLGLWNSVAGTVMVEGLLFVAGVWIYVTGTRAGDHIGTLALWSFLIVLIVLYIAALTSPPPPSAREVAVVGLAAWLFPFWAAWFDRHRNVAVWAIH